MTDLARCGRFGPMEAGRKFFIGVVPEGLENNAPLKVLLGKMKRTLKEREKEARWATPDLWHTTLQFFGHLNDRELQTTVEGFSSWKPRSPEVELKIQGVGAFPDPHEARVLWLGIQKSKELENLRNELIDYFKTRGIDKPDAHSFVPHLTLARLRNLQSVDDLIRLGGRKAIGVYPIREVILFESVVQGNIKKYVPVARRSLRQ